MQVTTIFSNRLNDRILEESVSCAFELKLLLQYNSVGEKIFMDINATFL